VCDSCKNGLPHIVWGAHSSLEKKFMKFNLFLCLPVILALVVFAGCMNVATDQALTTTNIGYVEAFSGIALARVPGGSFIMGSPEDEKGRDSSEGPSHTVHINAFYLGTCEITQGQWKKIMGDNPPAFKSGDTYPVENISWMDAQKFIRLLSKKSGISFRLPTEAEWEYACRAGTQTPFFSGSDNETLLEYAWFDRNSGGETNPVAARLANKWGLFDMHGNVSEWVGDGRRGYLSREERNPQGPPTAHKAIHRGGAWLYPAYMCRSAKRITAPKDFRTHIIGLRVALDANAFLPPHR